MRKIKAGFVLLCLASVLSSCASKKDTVAKDTMAGVPHAYQEAVKAGRLSPAAARSLRGSAPQVDRMDAFVDRVEKARAKINRMNIPEAEKRRLIRIEMSKASQDGKHK